jgi:hypothetical protein
LEKLLELELELELEVELEEEAEVEEEVGVEVEVDADSEVEVVEGVVEASFVCFLECRSAVTARYFLRRSWRVISSMSTGT